MQLRIPSRRGFTFSRENSEHKNLTYHAGAWATIPSQQSSILPTDNFYLIVGRKWLQRERVEVFAEESYCTIRDLDYPRCLFKFPAYVPKAQRSLQVKACQPDSQVALQQKLESTILPTADDAQDEFSRIRGELVGTSEPGIGPTGSKFTQSEATSSDDDLKRICCPTFLSSPAGWNPQGGSPPAGWIPQGGSPRFLFLLLPSCVRLLLPLSRITRTLVIFNRKGDDLINSRSLLLVYLVDLAQRSLQSASSYAYHHGNAFDKLVAFVLGTGILLPLFSTSMPFKALIKDTSADESLDLIAQLSVLIYGVPMDGKVGRLGAESADSESGRPLATRLWGGEHRPTHRTGLQSPLPRLRPTLARLRVGINWGRPSHPTRLCHPWVYLRSRWNS
ncbi:hypothetical protein Taro_035875 [Colocasia esculenta]|uniref:Uncharacterized protein n=1 Tax=Colocasia esculenta TaxID=4460 RepID=A0A843WJY5_COLES|nr:hypothetical protein [Colocasia esculenta]